MAGVPGQPSPPPDLDALKTGRKRLAQQEADLTERVAGISTDAFGRRTEQVPTGTRSVPRGLHDPERQLADVTRQRKLFDSRIEEVETERAQQQQQQQSAGGGADAAGQAEARRKAALGAQRQAAIRASGRLAGTTGGAEGVSELRRRRDRNSGSASQTLGV